MCHNFKIPDLISGIFIIITVILPAFISDIIDLGRAHYRTEASEALAFALAGIAGFFIFTQCGRTWVASPDRGKRRWRHGRQADF